MDRYFCNRIHTQLTKLASIFLTMSLAQARAEYRRKLAVHKAAKKADADKNYNKNKIYKPRTFTVTCRYCKEEGHKVGHFDKKLGRFVTTCVKALAASKRKADYNKRQREKTTDWKNQVSAAVAEETGSDGWSTAGSKNKVSAAKKTEKPVLKFAKNRFALDEDSDEETGPTTWSAPAPIGAWSKGAPAKVELTRAPRKTTTPLNSDSSDDDAAFADPAPALERSTGAPPSPHSPVPESWGDAW